MKFDKIQVPKVGKLKMPNINMKAPKGLTAKGVMAAPKHLGGGKAMSPPSGKLPTLADMKRTVPKGGLLNKGLRQNYGKVPGLDI